MKRSPILSIALRALIAGLAVVVLASCTNQTENPAQPTVTNTSPTEQLVRTNTSEPTEERATFRTTEQIPVATIDEVITELTQLQEANQAFLTQSGWFHYEIESSIGSNPGQREADLVLYGWNPNISLSPVRIREEWLEVIDDQGTLGTGRYSVTSDGDGNLAQVLALDSQGNGGNLTLLEQGLSETLIDPENLESQLGQIIKQFEQIREIDSELRAGYVEGRDGLEYQIELKVAARNEMYEMDWLPEPVGGFMLFYRVDSTTGMLLEFSEWDINISREIYRTYSEITHFTEFVDSMPADVQQDYEAALERYQELINEIEH